MKRIAVLLAALALTLAACGGSEADAGVATLEDSSTAVDDTAVAQLSDEATTAEDSEAAVLEWAACMREAGVDIEDPTVDADGNVQLGGASIFGRGRNGGAGGDGTAEDGPGFDDAAQAAFEECGAILEGVAFGGGGRGDFDAEGIQDQMYEYAACMRENGVDMDDPVIGEPGGGGQGGGGLFGDIDRDDPAFEAAQDVCGDLLAGFGPGGGGPGGAGAPGGGEDA